MEEVAASVKYGFFRKLKVWFGRPPVLIYTMGKVGSSSIAISLRARGVAEVQPHSLTWVRKGSYFVSPNLSVLGEIFYSGKTALIRAKLTCFKLINRIIRRRIKIICIYRDPIARNISAFFEQYSYVLDGDINSLPTPEVLDCFWMYARHDTPLDWFERELKKSFGVDIFSVPFDRLRGYGVLRQGYRDVLLLTMEKMRENETVIGEFLGLQAFHITPANRAERKHYATAYNAFKRELVISEAYAEKMYASPVVRYFYSDEDILKFRRRWKIR